MLGTRNILIGVDFSPACVAAVREGARLARLGVGTATAMHVLEVPAQMAMHHGYAPRPVDLIATLTERAKAKWADLTATLGPVPHVEFVMPTGSPASTLLARAEPLAHTFLVMGINGCDPARPGVGTVAAQCVRYASCPILLVAPTFVGPHKHILLATDFSSTAALAARWADEAAITEGAKLTVLHVLAARDASREEATDRLGHFVQDHLPRSGAAAQALVVDRAERGKTIAKVAAEQNVDLIIMGRRGHSPIRHLFVGSTAERVLQDISCNVLLLSPHAG